MAVVASNVIPYQGNSIMLPEDVGLVDDDEPVQMKREFTFTLKKTSDKSEDE